MKNFEAEYIQKPRLLQVGDVIKIQGHGDTQWTVDGFSHSHRDIIHIFTYISHKNEVKRKTINFEDIKEVM